MSREAHVRICERLGSMIPVDSTAYSISIEGSISDLVKRLKGRTSRNLQREFPVLKKRYWGQHFWDIGYEAWSVGNVTDEMVQEYLEHHRHPSNKDTGKIILA